MPTDPMWCFENYGEAAEYIDQLEKQRDELLAALKVFADKYNSAPDGDLGIGLVNGDFFRAIEAIAKLDRAQAEIRALEDKLREDAA